MNTRRQIKKILGLAALRRRVAITTSSISLGATLAYRPPAHEDDSNILVLADGLTQETGPPA